jgi:hypothetical protein
VQLLIQGNESERTSLIQEGDAINIDVTAPGAILALGLIYIRSGYVLYLFSIVFVDFYYP